MGAPRCPPRLTALCGEFEGVSSLSGTGGEEFFSGKSEAKLQNNLCRTDRGLYVSRITVCFVANLNQIADLRDDFYKK